LCAEKYCELFSTLNGFSLVIVRLQSPYGVGMRGVVLTFLKRALNGEQITIFGDGSQTRTYLYITDVIAAYVALIDRGRGVYNITHTQEITIKDLAEKILKLTNSPSKIRYTKAAQEEEILPRLSIDKARREIGWSPTISIDVGLSLMIKQLKAV
jgi:UDP-glucuronate decarboxylase